MQTVLTHPSPTRRSSDLLETDKGAVDVPSPVAGVMGELVVTEGDTVEVGALLAYIEEGGGAPAKKEASAAAPAAPAAASAPAPAPAKTAEPAQEIGRASCRARVCQYV